MFRRIFVNSSLQKVNDEVDAAKNQGKFMFMDQRQLLTFGYVKDLPVADYEKKLVMDQALSGNQIYIDAFYADLQKHRFSMSVSEPIRKSCKENQKLRQKKNNRGFTGIPALLKYYKPKAV